jgi:hypothetical protein
MAQEAAVTVVMRMRDEASQGMQNFGANTQQAQIESLQLNSALTAMGSALTGVGSLLNQLDSPMAKVAATTITTAGAILATSSAIIQAIPYIKQMTASLRNMAIAQALVRALSGPAGWLTLGAGLAIGGAAAYGISRATQAAPRSTGTTVNNYIQGDVVTERSVGDISRRSIVQNQSRNATSGIR